MSSVVKQAESVILNGILLDFKCTDAEYCIIVAKDDDPSRTNSSYFTWLY